MSSAFEPSSFAWPADADLRDEQVAAVALLLLGGEDDRRLEVEPGALPGLEAAAHRGDVGVAHVGQGLGREQRADAAGAVQDHGRVAVRRRRPRSAARCSSSRCGGAGQVALLPLGRLADVDDGGGAGGEGIDLLRGDFSDLGAGLAKEVRVGLRHGAGGLRWSTGWRRDGARAGRTRVRGATRCGRAGSGRPATPAAALDPGGHAPASAAAASRDRGARRDRRGRAGGCRG